MKKSFKRGLKSRNIIKKAKGFFEETSAGKAICEGLRKGELYVCIRENYFNVYRNGCSLLEYRPNANKHIFLINKKYWYADMEGIRRSGKSYLSLDLNNKNESTQYYIEHIIKRPNEKLKEYLFSKNKDGVSEKELLQAYIEVKRPCLIDLEVAFSCKTTKQDAKRDMVAKRIDLAVLERVDGKVELQFIEAKLVSDSRLRAEQREPEVINQMKEYEDFIVDQTVNIQSSYNAIAQNYVNNFPYLISDEQKSLMNECLSSIEVSKKPKLLLLSDSSPIESALKGTNGKNNGDHYKTLKDICNEKEWSVLEWVQNE